MRFITCTLLLFVLVTSSMLCLAAKEASYTDEDIALVTQILEDAIKNKDPYILMNAISQIETYGIPYNLLRTSKEALTSLKTEYCDTEIGKDYIKLDTLLDSDKFYEAELLLDLILICGQTYESANVSREKIQEIKQEFYLKKITEYVILYATDLNTIRLDMIQTYMRLAGLNTWKQKLHGVNNIDSLEFTEGKVLTFH